MQEAVFEEKNKYAIINTMSLNKQECLIKNTIPCKKETEFINTILKKDTTEAEQLPPIGFLVYLFCMEKMQPMKRYIKNTNNSYHWV